MEITQNLKLLNINSLNPQPTRKSALNQGPFNNDIAFISNSLADKSDWEVLLTRGSDYFPYLCFIKRLLMPASSSQKSLVDPGIKYTLKDWSNYRRLLDSKLTEKNYYSENLITIIGQTLYLSKRQE